MTIEVIEGSFFKDFDMSGKMDPFVEIEYQPKRKGIEKDQVANKDGVVKN